jgi:hypothetical protein
VRSIPFANRQGDLGTIFVVSLSLNCTGFTESQVYGSCDGGHTVVASDDFLNDVMSQIGAKLKLSTHRVAFNDDILITGPTDIEGHLGLDSESLNLIAYLLGRDGKYYLLDFGRVFPPEFPEHSPEVMYNLLRPNLLHHAKVIALGYFFFPEYLCSVSVSVYISLTYSALCSDAFLGFIPKEDKISEIERIREATIVLLNDVIPAFAAALDAGLFFLLPCSRVSESSFNLLDSSLFGQVEPENLASIIHKEGINCRHLGRIRDRLKSEKLRRVFLTEIVARTLVRFSCQLFYLPNSLKFLSLEKCDEGIDAKANE